MHRPLSPSERLRTLTSLALAAGLFATVGWTAMQPGDPLGAVSLVGHPHPVQTLLVGLALSVVAALFGEILVGARLCHFGVFASSFGFSVLSLRGGTMRDLLLGFDTTDNAVQSRVHTDLAGEAVLWSMVMLGSLLASAWLVRWLRANGDRNRDAFGEGASKPVDGLRPVRSKSPALPPVSRARSVRDGLCALVAVSAVAMLVIHVTAAESAVDAIRTGQVFFSVGVSFYLGSWLAVQIFPNATFAWIAPAVPLVAIAGYMAAARSHGFTGWLLPYNEVVAVPRNAFSRALPLEHLAVGIQGVLLGLWNARKHDADAPGAS